MSLFIDQKSFVPIIETPSGTGDSFRNVQKFTMGAGSSRIEMDIKTGFFIGADTFATAPFNLDFLGNLLASSVTIKNSEGDVLIDSNSSTMDYVQIINSALNTSSKTILSDFTFSATDYEGAFKTGTIAWSASTGLVTSGSGVVINARGILGANAGVATFTLDATTGNATFAGTLSAPSGTLGTITAGTITGATITAKSGTTGTNITLDSSSGAAIFKYDNTAIGSIASDSTSGMLYSANGSHFFFKSGVYAAEINGDGILIPSGNDFYVGGLRGETPGGKEFITSLRWDGGTLQRKGRVITFTGGICTDMGAESGWSDV